MVVQGYFPFSHLVISLRLGHLEAVTSVVSTLAFISFSRNTLRSII